TFSHALLQAVAPLEAAPLQDALGQLVAAEVVTQRGIPPQATYTFKHALIQDAAYQSLLRSTRQSTTSALRRYWWSGSRRQQRCNLSSWRITLRRLASRNRPLPTGSERGSRPSSARLTWKLLSTSRQAW